MERRKGKSSSRGPFIATRKWHRKWREENRCYLLQYNKIPKYLGTEVFKCTKQVEEESVNVLLDISLLTLPITHCWCSITAGITWLWLNFCLFDFFVNTQRRIYSFCQEILALCSSVKISVQFSLGLGVKPPIIPTNVWEFHFFRR